MTREQLALAHAAPDLETLQRQLVGIWDGHEYDVEGEIGDIRSTPDAGRSVVACFGADRALTTLAADESPRAGPGCRPMTRTYVLRREPEQDNELLLEAQLSGGCPDDAGYEKPYKELYYVSRIDDEFLVVRDASTGTYRGYRRRVNAR